MAWTPTYDTVGTYGGTTGAHLLNGISSQRMFDEVIHRAFLDLVPEATPMTTLLLRLPTEKTTDPDFKWDEHRPGWYTQKFYLAGTIACSSSAPGASFTIAVSSTTGTADVGYLKLRDKFLVRDADDPSKQAVFIVTAVNSQQEVVATLMTNTPGFNGADNDPCYLLGSSFNEGSAKATPMNDSVDTFWGSCEIIKNSTGITKTLNATALPWGPERSRRVADTLIRHKLAYEWMIMMGERVGTTAANPFSAPRSTTVTSLTATERTSLGIRQVCGYADTIGMGGSRVFMETLGTFSWDNWVDRTAVLSEFGPSQRLFLAGTNVISMFNKWATDPLSKNYVNMDPKSQDNRYGFKIGTIFTDHMDAKIVKHPLLHGDFANMMYVVNLDALKLRTLRAMNFEDNIQTPGTDGIEGQYLSEVGLEIGQPETHGLFYFA